MASIAVPVKVKGDDITRIATGYAGNFVMIEVNGHVHLVSKDSISSEAHKQLNIRLRESRKGEK